MRSRSGDVVTSEVVADDDDVLEVSRRRFDEALDRLHSLLPLDDPSSELWDVWLELVEVGSRR